jgi:transposase-like protein
MRGDVAYYATLLPTRCRRHHEPDPSIQAEANRLYWETDESVAEIARRFDLSRRALYDAIEPLPSGGRARCAARRSASRTDRHARPVMPRVRSARPRATGATDFDMPVPQRSPEQDDDRVAMLGGAALVGAIAGAHAHVRGGVAEVTDAPRGR